MAEENIYETLAVKEAEQRKQRMQGVLDFASQFNPDQSAEAQKLSRTSGMPLDTVERNQPEIAARERARLAEVDSIIQSSPILARQLLDPNFTKVAQDDLKNTQSIEQTITEGLVGFSRWLRNDAKEVPGKVLSTFGSSFRSANAGLWGYGVEMPAELVGLDSVAGFAKKQRKENEQIAEYIRGYWGTKGKNSYLSTQFYHALESVWQSLATLPAGVQSAAAKPLQAASGNMVQRFLAAGQEVPIQTLLPLMAVAGGQSYGRARDQGVSPLLAAGYATSDAVVEGATEQITLGRFVRDLKVGAPLWRLLGNQLLTENVGEQAATALQDLNAWAVLPENKDKTFGDYLDARPAAALDTLIQTTIATTLQTGLMGTASTGMRETNRANQANQSAEMLLRLSQLAEASKVRSRDAESFQQYLAEVADEGPVQEVWVSPNTLMQSGVDVQALAQLSPSFAEQLDDALQTGGEVRIPVAEFATALPGTGFEQAILPHLRTDPDAMTQSEAQVFMQSQAEEFQREAETVLAKVEERSAFDTSAQVVEDSILSQLKTANRFTEDVNREYAKVARAVFSSAAARMNVTPEEAYKKFALQIRAQQIAAQYDQKSGQLKTETPEFKAWFGDSKVVDAEGRPLVVYHGTQTSFDRFSYEKQGDTVRSSDVGFFFTNHRKEANAYAEWDWDREQPAPNVMPVYLSITNPLVVDISNPHHKAEAPGLWYDAYGQQMVQYAEDNGYDGLIISDFGGGSERPTSVVSGKQTNYVTFRPEQIKSVFNRGTFDPNDPNILNQSAEVSATMTDEERAVSLVDWVFGDRPPFTTATRVRELGEMFVEMSPKAHADYTDENKAFIAGVMVKELDAAFKSGKAVTAWYEHNIRQMHDIVALEFPEIATDPEARFAFDYILAVLSNGQTVPVNFKNAMRFYERYRAEKRMPSVDSTYGVRHNLMAHAFQLYNTAKNEIGVETFREFMLSKHPVVTLNGMRTSPVRELVDQEVYGGTIIGSKIGGAFLQNISGNHDALTMDTWWMRTWGRLTGTLLASKYDPTDPSDTGLKDSTDSGAHKAFMRETAAEALSQLRKMGYTDLQMDGLQATYWYMEKELYAINGNADADVEGTDYGTEAARHAAKNGYADNPLVAEVLRDAQQPLGRGGRGADGRAREGGRADQVFNQEGLNYGPAGRQLSADQDNLATVGGRAPDGGWRDATRVRRANGEPARVARGAAEELRADHFQLGYLGRASGNPSSGLGVWFTYDFAEAARYGDTVENFFLDLRNPFVLKEAPPGFESVEEAYRWRESLRAQGHDGIVLDYRPLGGPVHFVAFDPHQVIRENPLPSLDFTTFFQSSVRQPVTSSTPIADIEEFNANMPAFLRRPGWAIITGIQEKLGAFDTPANIKANAKLEAELRDRGLPFKKGPGKYLNVDQGDSFLVKMSEAEALDLAKRYGQQSVLTNEGYVYQNGSLTPVDHTKDTFGDEARKQDGYTEIDGKAFSLGLDFSQEIAKEDRVNPALPFAIHGIKAIHYSKAERSTLDGHRFGEGLTGAERERLRDADPRLRVRTAFYVSNGRGVFPEAGVGPVAHLSTLNNLYDADVDALHIWGKHRDANARELAVIEAGYAGYLGRDTFDRQGTAVVFGRSDLPTKKVDNPAGVAEVPAPPNISEVQRVRRAVATSPHYPAGQMSRSAWGEYVKQIDPPYFETLAPFGVFEGEEVVYRDELLRTALEQEGKAPRGQISFGTDITQQPSIISLLQQADLTTFIHELGHFQLEVLASMSAQGDASAQRDMQTLLGWFGVADLATWNGLSLEEKRPYHEQFARGFEAYTLEGKAPSIELQGTFARVRAWMLNIYKSLTQLNVQLTDEVRGVFDRMLATEQQIAESETQRGYAALFESADAAGMTPEEWAEYQSLGAQATEDATAELQARSVRNMRWVSNAKSRALKALQKDAVAKRKAVEAEVREEVRRQPVYAARRFLAYGELGPEVLFGKGEELAGKLDLGALKAMYGEGPAAPWRYLPTGENGLAASEGLHPDAVAEMFGFTSGDHLVRELIGAEQEASVIEGVTDQRMLERYGDLTTPEAIERAAEKAIHNEARAKFIATELNALARATGQRKVLVPAAREFADRTVARQLIRLLKPTQYAAAEARAAKAAMTALKAGNTNEAAVEKRNQLLNNLTAKAANEAAADIESGVAYLKKFDREGTRSKVDIDYLDQIDAILERFDLRTGQSLKAIDKRKSLADWIAKQEEMGLEPAIPDSLRNEAFRKHFKDLTVEEFRGLLDSVRNIEHLGRLKTKLLTAVRQREFAAAVEEIVTSIEANAKGTVAERRSSDRGRLVAAGQLARSFLSDHRKFASLAREMDGWQDGGVMWEYLVRGMNAAGDKEASMREAATVKLSELLKPILKKGGMGKKTYFPQIGKSFTREERIGIALNMGNEINRERVMSGEKLGPVQLQAILDTITPEEGDFVQAVWTFFESYRPQIAEKQRRLTGTEPEWVQPTQVFLGGKYREGGYYPIAYDPLRSSRAEADTAAEVQRQIERGLYVQAQTRRGHLKARTDSTGRPLRYDLGVIVKHVDQVVHDLAWHEFLIDANRLLRNGRVDGAIREHYGPEKLATMKDTLRDIAIGDMAAQGSLDRILNHLRHGATIVGLGWRVTTSLLQPLGLTQSMVRIGPQWVAKGARHWMGDTVSLENSARLIGEKSTFMRLRSKTLQREINEIRNKVKGKDSVMEASYFYLIQKMQLVADIPTWWGAYEKAMSTEENEARAIALADQAVLDAQGSGQIKDLSAVQRGGAGWKLFTTFYSFFNTTYQNTVEAVGRTNFKSPASIGLLGVDLLLLYTIPAMLGTLMKVGLSGDWEDEDKLLRRLLADQVSYLTGTMMLVREGGGIAQNLIDPQHAFDYTGPASLRFFASVSNLAKQAGQGEADEAFWKALNETLGMIFHYPAGQINATLDGVTSIADGKTENPGALIVGHRDR